MFLVVLKLFANWDLQQLIYLFFFFCIFFGYCYSHHFLYLYYPLVRFLSF